MDNLKVPIITEYVGGCADLIVKPDINSQPRVQMFTSHVVQSPYVVGTEPPLLLTGVEMEYAKYVMGAKVKEDCRILYIARRFSNSNAIVGDPVQYTIFVNPIGTNLIDVIDFELYQSDHQYFGFNYELNKDIKLSQDTILRKDTWLVRSPKVQGESDLYSIGVHANTLTASYNCNGIPKQLTVISLQVSLGKREIHATSQSMSLVLVMLRAIILKNR